MPPKPKSPASPKRTPGVTYFEVELDPKVIEEAFEVVHLQGVLADAPPKTLYELKRIAEQARATGSFELAQEIVQTYPLLKSFIPQSSGDWAQWLSFLVSAIALVLSNGRTRSWRSLNSKLAKLKLQVERLQAERRKKKTKPAKVKKPRKKTQAKKKPKKVVPLKKPTIAPRGRA